MTTAWRLAGDGATGHATGLGLTTRFEYPANPHRTSGATSRMHNGDVRRLPDTVVR